MSPHFLGMTEQIEKIESLTTPLLADTDIFLTSVRIKPVNNVKVFLDADSGLSIEKCIQINRKLYPLIEESGMFPGGDFSLEVSSPGVEEPLVSIRQYRKNNGRTLAVTLVDGTEKTGILKEVQEEKIILEIKVPKVKVPQTLEIPFTSIKKSIVQIIF